jgi:hypothetical protein
MVQRRLLRSLLPRCWLLGVAHANVLLLGASAGAARGQRGRKTRRSLIVDSDEP